MATIDTIEDLIHLLDENPEWVEALRARLLTQELLELPERFSQFAERMDQFVEQMNQFVEAANKRFDAIEVQQVQFSEEMKAVRRDLAILKGGHARTAAIRNAPTIARKIGLRRTKTLSEDDLWDITDSADTSDIHANVLDSFRNADLVMEATDTEGQVCYVATEISFTVHQMDISRATRNSRLLTRFTGRPAFAAVAGEYAHEDVLDVLDSDGVFWHRLKRSDMEVD